jgi:hypothetical protein
MATKAAPKKAATTKKAPAKATGKKCCGCKK